MKGVTIHIWSRVLDLRNNLRKPIEDELNDQVKDQARTQVLNQLQLQVSDQLYTQVLLFFIIHKNQIQSYNG
jgi:hypothetical protein